MTKAGIPGERIDEILKELSCAFEHGRPELAPELRMEGGTKLFSVSRTRGTTASPTSCQERPSQDPELLRESGQAQLGSPEMRPAIVPAHSRRTGAEEQAAVDVSRSVTAAELADGVKIRVSWADLTDEEDLEKGRRIFLELKPGEDGIIRARRVEALPEVDQSPDKLFEEGWARGSREGGRGLLLGGPWVSGGALKREPSQALSRPAVNSIRR